MGWARDLGQPAIRPGIEVCQRHPTHVFLLYLSAILQNMDLREAVDKARQILDEEESRPTMNYRYVSSEWPRELFYEFEMKKQGYIPAVAGITAIFRMRAKPRPREVYENPNEWELDSTNYGLLMAIFSQLPPTNRPMFLTGLLNITVAKHVPRISPARHIFPSWSGYVSALPLLAEFCIRNNLMSILAAVLDKVKMPNANIAVMMIQLEEMISLNFNAFSDAELEAMPEALKNVREIAERQTWQTRGRSGMPQTTNRFYRQGYSSEGTEIVKAIDAFLAQCKQARFFYLKGALQQSRNFEVESDRRAVEEYLTKIGFSDLMVQSLNAAEQDFKNTATFFELKNCMGHLRSFLEELHVQACPPFATPTDTLPSKWGNATLFLRQRDVITLKEEAFITTLYTLVSDEGIHPLIADREYARLFRNMVIEYGLLFLTVLQKKGIKVRASTA